MVRHPLRQGCRTSVRESHFIDLPSPSLFLHLNVALFRMEFAGRGELSERQQKLGQHLGHLVRLAEEFNIAVVVINQCMADPGTCCCCCCCCFLL